MRGRTLSTTSQVLSLGRATAPQAPSHSPCHCTSGSAFRSSRAQFLMTDVNTYRSNTPLTGHRQHVSSPHPFGTPASQAFTRTAVNTSQVRSPPINPGFFTCTCTITHIATFTNYIMRAPGTLTTPQFTNSLHHVNHSPCRT